MTWQEWFLNPFLVFRTLFNGGLLRAPEEGLPLSELNRLPELSEPGALSSVITQATENSSEIPPLLWIGVFLILFLFGVSLYFYGLQNIDLLRTIDACLVELRRSGDDLTSIDRIFSKSESLSKTWRETQGHLIQHKGTAPILLGDWSEHFSLQRTLKRESAIRFYSIIPSTLTGLGLLFTFIAILEGLSSVRVSEDYQVTGLAGLINGLSGKFLTSILALAGALLFSLIDRFIQMRLEHSWEVLLSTLRTKIPERTIAMLLSKSER